MYLRSAMFWGVSEGLWVSRMSIMSRFRLRRFWEIADESRG